MLLIKLSILPFIKNKFMLCKELNEKKPKFIYLQSGHKGFTEHSGGAR